jgi:hypothetical protein
MGSLLSPVYRVILERDLFSLIGWDLALYTASTLKITLRISYLITQLLQTCTLQCDHFFFTNAFVRKILHFRTKTINLFSKLQG